ncbi:DUF378 domain-containing protein [Candidatus Woesearchaeota archaeon]|nr:DUF378 domain-containing protein [Candidatus Woesearchaeota archaeon]
MANNVIDWIAAILVIIGGLNWLLVGALEFNLVTTIFGEGMLTRIVYIIVGIAAIYMIYYLMKK